MPETLSLWLQFVAIYELELHLGGSCEVALDVDDMVYADITQHGDIGDIGDIPITFTIDGGDK